MSGDVGDVRSNVVSATANDDDGNTVQGFDQDDVVIGNLDPVIRARKVAAPTSLPEPGGTVTFTVTVINDSVEPVTLQTIPDDVYGDLDGQGTCRLPQTLTANGGFYTCTFRGAVTGSAADSPYTDTFTPTVIDNEGNVGSAVATADVILTDRVPRHHRGEEPPAGQPAGAGWRLHLPGHRHQRQHHRGCRPDGPRR